MEVYENVKLLRMKKEITVNRMFYKKVGPSGLADIAREFKIIGDEVFVRQHAKKSDKILDLACGWGRVSVPLARAGFDVTGIDLAENLIREARKKAKQVNVRVKFAVGNMTALPYTDASFDKIFCLWNSFNELLTVREQVRALNEVHRVLKEGGEAFFITLYSDKKEIQSSGRSRLLESELKGARAFQYAHDKETLVKIIKKSRFKTGIVKGITMHGKKRLGMFLRKKNA